MAASINADNGVVSGSAGLKSSADSTGVLALQTNGTTAVSISAAQVVSLTSGLAVTGPTTILKNGGTGATAGLLLSGGGASTNFNIDYGTVASNRLYFRQNYFDGSGHITFQYSSDGTMASPIDVLAIKYGGGIAVTGLTDISAATSGQIKFPATQNASSNANTLDDYEEGTWTPSLGGTAVYDIRTGTYTKVGNVVTITGSIRPSSLGTGSTNTLTGLPFSVAADVAGGIAYGDGWAVSVYSVYLYISGTSLITYGYTGAAANTPLVNLFQTNARIYFSATYLTS